MKYYLLPQNGNLYKANMHCHTTVSDGKHTVEEMKEAYKAKGYNIIAYSDHAGTKIKITEHSDLNDDTFLALTSGEIALGDPLQRGGTANTARSCHFNVIARDPHNFEQLDLDGAGSCDGEMFNKILKQCVDKNYIVNINHPNWSLLNENEFLNFEHCTGFEIYNCITSNFGGALSYSYDVYINGLRNGKRWFAIGGDDSHSHNSDFRHPLNDSFGAFTYYKAPSLTYDNIIKALENGDCYCSMGPVIKDLYIENGILYVVTSGVKSVTVSTDSRYQPFIRAEKNSELTTAQIKLDKDKFSKFIVVDVVDGKGMHAITRPYYLGENFEL